MTSVGTGDYQEYVKDQGGPVYVDLSSAEMVARHTHKASCCLGLIHEGERYLRSVYLVDGELRTHRQHVSERCQEEPTE